MRLSSLRTKIFLLLGLTLLLSAMAVLLVAQRDVNDTVISSERLAVHNVLNLVLHDSEARWASLLDDKIATIRHDRKDLMHLGKMVHSLLANYQTEVQEGRMGHDQAQSLAIQWLDRLDVDNERNTLVFDRSLHVLASNTPDFRDTDISGLVDFKGHPMAASAYREASTSGHSFALYRTSGGDLRYAYFGYFAPWDWVFAISGNAQEVVHQFEERRLAMEYSLRKTLTKLRLAQSGYVFIIDDNSNIIALPEKGLAGLLDKTDHNTGQPLRNMIPRSGATGEIVSFRFDGVDGRGLGPWEVNATYFKPLGWSIVAVVPQEDLTRAATGLRNRLAAIFITVMVLSLLIAWGFAARIVQPLHRLSEHARALPEQDLSLPATVPDDIASLPGTRHDEVGRLAATFIYMDQQLREKVTWLVQETSRRERFESELKIAHDIQMGLLPLPLPASVMNRLAVHASMIPAKEVGGDLYDYFLLDDGRLCLVIGDVSDKGVPAALFMAVTRTLVRACAEDETDPGLLMERVNNRLSANNPNLMFVTLVIAVIDLDTGHMAWANAGHLPLCVLGQGGALRLLDSRSGPACGVQAELQYSCFQDSLQPGELLLGYTDGVTEALNPEGELFGDPRLYELLQKVPRHSPEALTGHILQTVHDFALDTEQSDDITMVVALRAG